MKVLIDISEEEYNLIKMKLESNIGGVSSEAERAIAKGTAFFKSEYEHDHAVVKAYNDGQAYILDKIRAEIEKFTSIYTISHERGAIGHVEWTDKLIKESEILDIIDIYRKAIK